MVVGSVLGCNLQLIIDVLGVINLIPQKCTTFVTIVYMVDREMWKKNDKSM